MGGRADAVGWERARREGRREWRGPSARAPTPPAPWDGGAGVAGAARHSAAPPPARARRRRQRSATQSMHSDVFPQGRRMTPKALDRKYSKHITVLFYASTTVLLNLPPAV